MPVNETFDNEDHAGLRPFEEELAGCVLNGCNFAGSDFSELLVVDTEFVGCDLTNADFANARLQDVRFDTCKLLGVEFSGCSDFGFQVAFSACNLDYATFADFAMKNTRMSGCSLRETDFSRTDLSGGKMTDCDMTGAVFAGTILERADLRGSHGFAIDPERNRVTRARFSPESLAGLLLRYRLRLD